MLLFVNCPPEAPANEPCLWQAWVIGDAVGHPAPYAYAEDHATHAGATARQPARTVRGERVTAKKVDNTYHGVTGDCGCGVEETEQIRGVWYIFSKERTQHRQEGRFQIAAGHRALRPQPGCFEHDLCFRVEAAIPGHQHVETSTPAPSAAVAVAISSADHSEPKHAHPSAPNCNVPDSRSPQQAPASITARLALPSSTNNDLTLSLKAHIVRPEAISSSRLLSPSAVRQSQPLDAGAAGHVAQPVSSPAALGPQHTPPAQVPDVLLIPKSRAPEQPAPSQATDAGPPSPLIPVLLKAPGLGALGPPVDTGLAPDEGPAQHALNKGRKEQEEEDDAESVYDLQSHEGDISAAEQAAGAKARRKSAADGLLNFVFLDQSDEIQKLAEDAGEEELFLWTLEKLEEKIQDKATAQAIFYRREDFRNSRAPSRRPTMHRNQLQSGEDLFRARMLASRRLDELADVLGDRPLADRDHNSI
jgi:hypothetical protein